MISEAKLGAIIVAALVCVALTLTLFQALHNLGMAIAISVPSALVLGGILFLFSSDDIKKKGGDKPSKGN